MFKNTRNNKGKANDMNVVNKKKGKTFQNIIMPKTKLVQKEA